MALPLNITHGFTLIEGLVSGAMATVIGSIMITVIYFNGNQVSSSALNAKMLQQYETAVSQIAGISRFANVALDDGEPWHSSAYSLSTTTTTKFFLFDRSGNRIGGFWIDGTTLKEWDLSINNWIPFRLGPADPPIQVSSIPSSNFILAPNRKAITVNINVVTRYCSLTDTVRSGWETFVCRN